MNNQINKPWINSGAVFLILLGISFIINIFIALTQFNTEWRIMTFVWFTASIIIFLLRNKFNVLDSELLLWKFITIFYPITEMLIRLGLKYDYLPDNIYLNSFSHILFSFGLYNLMFPIFSGLKASKFTLIVLCFALTNVLGNLNEIFQFYTRSNHLNPWYYQDTIRDIMMNLVGSVIGSIIFLICLKFTHAENS